MKHVLFAISYQLYHIHFNQFAIYLEPISQLPISHMTSNQCLFIFALCDSSPLQVQMFGEKFLKALRDRQLASVLSIEKVLSSWCIYASNASQWFTVKTSKKRIFATRHHGISKAEGSCGLLSNVTGMKLFGDLVLFFLSTCFAREFIWDLRSFISAWTITHYRCDQELSWIFRQVMKIYPLCNIDLM